MAKQKSKLAASFNKKVINEEKETNKNVLFSLLFKSKEDAHITHLMQPTQSYSDHMALQAFYEYMNGLVDALVEMYYGVHGITEKIEFKSEVISIKLSSYFTALLSAVKKVRTDYDKDAFMAAQIDDVEILIATTLYKLNNTRSNV